MGFFGNKKPLKQGSKSSSMQQDATPDLPAGSQDIKFPEFPSYEDTTSELDFDSIKEEATEQPTAEDFMSKENVEIPQRESKAPLGMQQAQPQSAPEVVPRETSQPNFRPSSNFESPGFSQSPTYSPPGPSYSNPQDDIASSRSAYTSQKPLFVKIEDYKDAVYTIDKIKAKLKEADAVLEELSKIRRQEDTQLEDWRHDIENIKAKLLDIDKTLFGE